MINMSICGKLDFFLKIAYGIARQPCCTKFRFRRLEMKRLVSLFAIFLVFALATTTLDAQDNRAVALYAIGGSGFSSSGSGGQLLNSGNGLGNQVGLGVDFNPEGFGLGLRFTNGSPISDSFRRNIPTRPEYTGQTPYIDEKAETRSRVFTAMFQKGFGNRKAKLILGAGPGMVMSKSDVTGTVGFAPREVIGYDAVGYSSSSNQSSFVGAFGATVVVRAGKNFDIRFGVQYLRGFTGDKNSYVFPVGGAGIGF